MDDLHTVDLDSPKAKHVGFRLAFDFEKEECSIYVWVSEKSNGGILCDASHSARINRGHPAYTIGVGRASVIKLGHPTRLPDKSQASWMYDAGSIGYGYWDHPRVTIHLKSKWPHDEWVHKFIQALIQGEADD